MPVKKAKPTYQFIRYDIRPSSGLTNDESEYLTNCALKLENHDNVAEVCIAFELPASQSEPRGTGLHCHFGIHFKTAVRTDKVPILKLASYAKMQKWSCHAVKIVTSELWTPTQYWKMGYIQKDGEAIGKCKDYSLHWFDHVRIMRQQKVRTTAITCNVLEDEIVNWWLGMYHRIIPDLKKINVERITGMHVLAHMICTSRCAFKLTRNMKHRMFYMTATLQDYHEVVRCLSHSSDFDYQVVLPEMKEKYPVGGLHSWAVPPRVPPTEVGENPKEKNDTI